MKASPCPMPSPCAARPLNLGGADLLTWSRAYLPNHFARGPSWMHRWLASELNDLGGVRGCKLNVIGPRGGAKSTVATLAYALRMALEGRERYIWIASDTRHQACAHLENIKAELIDNQWLRGDYHGATGQGPVWQASKIRLNNGVAIEAFGTGQRVRGYRYRATRPTLIICDDIQNDSHIESRRLRELSRRWFHGALARAGTKRTNLVHLATALHPEALALELARTPGWQSHVFAAVSEFPQQMALWGEWETLYANLELHEARSAARRFHAAAQARMEAGAVLLWPDEEDLYTLMCLRAESGRSAFAREKLSKPILPEVCEWPESYFDAHIWFDEWPARLVARTLALDPSKGRDSRRGDFSAHALLGIDEAGLIYVEAELAREPTAEIVARGVELYRRFRPDLFGVESNQFQELLGGLFEEEFRRQGVLGAAPALVDNRVNKLVRIRRLGPYLAARRLRFRQRSAGTALLVEQLREFPCADHDDGPDALEMALRLAGELLVGDEASDGLGDRLPL